MLRVSVVVCTYNRCEGLGGALESLMAQDAPPGSYELVVVDNNSTDATRSVIEGFASSGHPAVRYVFEGRQGLPHARNAGVAASRAPLVAFTDDDVRAEAGWVRTIMELFERYPEASFVGGKVLPEWPREPEPWLTEPRHWGPLALTDFGDEPFIVDAANPRCLIGANLAVRRSLFDRVGLFDPVQSRTEDHEFEIRAWEAGFHGVYSPELRIVAEVQPERLGRAYHRRWFAVHGRQSALMRLRERVVDGVGIRPLADLDSGQAVLFGSAAFVYRALLEQAVGWLADAVRGRRSEAFEHENAMRDLAGYIRGRAELTRFERPGLLGPAREIARFAVALVSGKLGRRGRADARAGER